MASPCLCVTNARTSVVERHSPLAALRQAYIARVTLPYGRSIPCGVLRGRMIEGSTAISCKERTLSMLSRSACRLAATSTRRLASWADISARRICSVLLANVRARRSTSHLSEEGILVRMPKGYPEHPSKSLGKCAIMAATTKKARQCRAFSFLLAGGLTGSLRWSGSRISCASPRCRPWQQPCRRSGSAGPSTASAVRRSLP